MKFVHYLLAVVSLAWVVTARAQQCLNCAAVVKCAGGDCYKMGNVERPLVGDAKAGDYCWEYCWGKVNNDCKRDFYSDINGAWRCPAGQVCRYLKRGAWKCFNEKIALKADDLCWDMDWPKEKLMAMRNEYCPEGTSCSMAGIWNNTRRKFYCKPLAPAPTCSAVPGSNYVNFKYWPQTYLPTGGLPCGGVYSACPASCALPTSG